jgi:uncharacterized protein YegL
MGWAKYQEDIISRWNQDNHLRSRPKLSPSSRIDAGRLGKPAIAAKGARGDSIIDSKDNDMTKLSDFTLSSARPLPVIVLADVSGSMAVNGKIDALNEAVSEMIATFAEEEDTRAEIHVSVITFGADGAKVHKPLKPAAEVTWESMTAAGRTPMGDALSIAQKLLEDHDVIPGRAYRPTLVLVSDGVPTDEWKTPLTSLLNSERAAKAVRFAMGIGDDADKEMLKAFLGDEEARVFEAHEAREIKKFFRWVTMSVTSRSRSANPNSIIAVEPTDLGDFDF